MAVKEVTELFDRPGTIAVDAVNFIVGEGIDQIIIIGFNSVTGDSKSWHRNLSRQQLLWLSKQLEFKAIHKRYPVEDEENGGLI